MKLVGWIGCLVLGSVGFAQTPGSKPDAVPDAETALRIAEKALIRIYGKAQINSERPLHADLEDNVWHVSGTLHCSDGKGGVTTICVGGVASARIRKRDGKVVEIVHTQ